MDWIEMVHILALLLSRLILWFSCNKACFVLSSDQSWQCFSTIWSKGLSRSTALTSFRNLRTTTRLDFLNAVLLNVSFTIISSPRWLTFSPVHLKHYTKKIIKIHRDVFAARLFFFLFFFSPSPGVIPFWAEPSQRAPGL